MPPPRATGVIEDPRFREHAGPTGHPERPERLSAVHDAIAARADALEARPPRAAEAEEIQRVHGAAHVAHLDAAVAHAPAQLDADTYVSERSAQIARLAAGASIDLARDVAAGRLRNGLAAVRPPGHHAEADHAMGFCLFNNVAVAAEALRAEEGIERVLIFDWDVHHGNGTQHSFEADPNVLYFSTHQFPYYPGTGAVGEMGVGDGAGATVNVPLPAGCGDDDYLAVLQRVLVPVARSFRPELILLSAGFDAHIDDPLAAMGVTRSGYADMARLVCALADEACEGRLACVLEGGYALSGLEEGTGALLDALLDPEPSAPADAPEPSAAVGRVIDALVAAHGPRTPDLGAA